MRRNTLAVTVSIAAALTSAAAVLAQQTSPSPVALQQARPTYAPDGTVHVPAFDLPPSSFLSPEALAALRQRANQPSVVAFPNLPIDQMRAGLERMLAPQVAAMEQNYAVDIAAQTIAGVNTRIVTPKAGEADRRRVLIDLHGGGFTECANACAMLESIPIAALGRYKVVTVDYRQGPEHVFPAASEDIAAVYRELLKTYRPENIGIYGCSAGGSLTAASEAWFQTHGLPNPGALGIFGAGGAPFGRGDSAYLAAYIEGSFPAPSSESAAPRAYFRGANMDDALISPALHPEIMARFPPTLIITGTRAPDLSPAIYTHTQLVKAGVESQLIVGEGMAHCFIYEDNLPEARDAHAIIVRFFNDHLGRRHHPRPTP